MSRGGQGLGILAMPREGQPRVGDILVAESEGAERGGGQPQPLIMAYSLPWPR